MIKSLIIPAGETIPISGSIRRFVVVQSPVGLNIRAGSEPFSNYVQQTGEELGQTVTLLEIQNPSASAITCSIYFDSIKRFIDSRIIPSPQQPNVPVITNIHLLGQTATAILDKSGKIITDANWNKWYAVQRVACTINNFSLVPLDPPTDDNFDPATVTVTFGNGTFFRVSSMGLATAATTDAQPYTFTFQGNFTLKISFDAGICDVDVVETYQAIPIDLPA